MGILKNIYNNYNKPKPYKNELWVINKIRNWYKSDDIRITIEKNLVNVRFGYWGDVDLSELKSLVGKYCNVVVNEYESDECGWLYSYEFILK